MSAVAERPYHALTVVPEIEAKILERIGQGISLQKIANEFGVDHMAILRRVEDHPDYKRLMRLSTRIKMERREAELESADTNVSVTRADRLLGHARWLAERLAADTYGQRQETTGVQIVINMPNLRDAAPQHAVIIPDPELPTS